MSTVHVRLKKPKPRAQSCTVLQSEAETLVGQVPQLIVIQCKNNNKNSTACFV